MKLIRDFNKCRGCIGGWEEGARKSKGSGSKFSI
jgi:hypothetical protein